MFEAKNKATSVWGQGQRHGSSVKAKATGLKATVSDQKQAQV